MSYRALSLTSLAVLLCPLLALGATKSPLPVDESPAGLAKASRVLFDKNQASHPISATLVIEPSQKIEATLETTHEFPGLTATEWIIYAPKPPNHPSQKLLEGGMQPVGNEIADLRWPDRRMLLARVSGPKQQNPHRLEVNVGYRLQLYKRNLNLAPAAPKSKTPVDRAGRDAALIPTETLDFATPRFQAWLGSEHLRPAPDETELNFARRAFLHLRGGFTYEYKGEMDRHSSNVCRLGKSDCGGLNGMLVSVLRANGIPARLLAGRWAESSKPGDNLGNLPYYQTHVKGEFFLGGVGWVPIDLSSGLADTSKEGLRFFGHDGGNFVTMHVDPDLEVDTIHFGRKTVQWMQGPMFWVTGSGKMDVGTEIDKWTVKIISSAAAGVAGQGLQPTAAKKKVSTSTGQN